MAPVVLLFYNRPEHLRQVYEAVAAARPPALFLVADGPKDPADAARCAAAREVVAQVDWPCSVHRNYAESNLGCMERVVSGLNWVFEQVPEAIILEDDCVPAPSFFPYCDELLARYRDDERVMEITGSNYQLGNVRSKDSYYFSRSFGIWGWATWRRAWALHDPTLAEWPVLRRDGFLEQALSDPDERAFWRPRFDDIATGRMRHTWDWQWQFALWAHHGLSIVPAVNLVTNIGFGADATILRTVDTPVANLPRGEMGPLVHPTAVFAHAAADRFAFEWFQGGWRYRGFAGRVRRLVATVRRSLRPVKDRLLGRRFGDLR